MRHLKTWREWLDRCSPINASTSNVTSIELDAMAEALALAAPAGPVGLTCDDDCACGVLGTRADPFADGWRAACDVMGDELRRVRARVR